MGEKVKIWVKQNFQFGLVTQKILRKLHGENGNMLEVRLNEHFAQLLYKYDESTILSSNI